MTSAALASRARPVVVVTGHAAGAVRAALAGLAVDIVHNEDFASGLAGSLRAGLAALPPEAAGALVLLGDMPGITGRLLDRLIDAFERDATADAVVPAHGGVRGNPALLGRALFDRAARLEGDQGARRLFASARVRDVAVDDPAVAIDIDDPATLARYSVLSTAK